MSGTIALVASSSEVSNENAEDNPKVTPDTVSKVKNTKGAKKLADTFLPFLMAAYEAGDESSPHINKKVQAVINKHTTGWYQLETKSNRNTQVFHNRNYTNIIIVANGTMTTGDMIKCYGDLFSPIQIILYHFLYYLSNQWFPTETSIAQAIYDYMKSKTCEFGSEERVNEFLQVISYMKEKYPTANVLLLGHSLGGWIVRRAAYAQNLGNKKVQSIIYNSAVGNTSISQKNEDWNIEVRIKGDLVSTSARSKNREFEFKSVSWFPLRNHLLINFAEDPSLYEEENLNFILNTNTRSQNLLSSLSSNPTTMLTMSNSNMLMPKLQMEHLLALKPSVVFNVEPSQHFMLEILPYLLLPLPPQLPVWEHGQLPMLRVWLERLLSPKPDADAAAPNVAPTLRLLHSPSPSPPSPSPPSPQSPSSPTPDAAAVAPYVAATSPLLPSPSPPSLSPPSQPSQPSQPSPLSPPSPLPPPSPSLPQRSDSVSKQELAQLMCLFRFQHVGNLNGILQRHQFLPLAPSATKRNFKPMSV